MSTSEVSNIMNINGTDIHQGKHATVKIKVGSLPSGTNINLFAHVYRSKNPGPTMLVLGGVHGDEVNGVEIVRRAVKVGYFDHLKHGNVIAVPLLNIYGFINFSRDLPDGKDVNRSFPGSSRGSLASKVAYTLSKHILPLVDFGLDFHTGGKSIHNYPQVRVSKDDRDAHKLAELFGAPFIVKSNLINKSLRKECHKRGIPMLVYEGGESLRLDSFAIQEGLNGIQRVMSSMGMTEKEPLAPKDPIVLEKNKWVRAGQAGILISYKKAGDYVNKGDLLGYLTDPYGVRELKVKSPYSGYIYGHNNMPVVHKGDAIYHIGFE
ncbi:succinylglutamate desuccinylase/aspartoacylase family protein [Parvicella tangerina]|uniref:N-alpha-acetyl-L-2,4-diaminobutyric acid deacetylase n=1 Tax=Parvicella tangerina TaxID=2829795 RepID=A0A916NGE2_9FLAO|nr:succinylglutamate desuccinylase/aspartoacylase family protein [Parvicella tangerina]CAG5080402.1 N-alpha-acetyl-L-2,4-diaminobutyric acid deacetylase [Parvicella tangerina]